jgi:hypothetical protein
MTNRQLIIALQLVAIPLILWLLYRLFFEDGYSRNDYAVMAIFFILLLIRDILRRKVRKEEQPKN